MKNLLKNALMLAVVSVTPLFISCDGKPEGPGEENPPVVVDGRIDSLETVLNRQIVAMQSVLGDGDAAVTACSLQQDGSYKVNLAGGLSFNALTDKQAYYRVVTVVDKAGSMCWAAVDKDGTVAPIRTAAGNDVTLESLPILKVKDDAVVLNIDGESYMTGYTIDDAVQAFDFEVKKDASSNVYAVTLKFAEGVERTFGVSGYPAASFCFSGSDDVVTGCYVESGKTVSLLLNVDASVEFTVNVTEGWSAVRKDAAGEVCIEISAPAVSAKGKVEVIIGGDVVLATAELSTEPFRDVFASFVNAVVNPYSGVSKFAYGISEASSYNADEIAALASKLISGELAASAGNAVSQESVCRNLSEVLGAELSADTEYVLWAAPALGTAAGSLTSVSFRKMTSSIEIIGEPTFLDAQIKVAASNVDALFGGVALKSDDLEAEVLFQINNSIYDSLSVADRSWTYEGKASEYKVSVGQSDVEMLPETEYVLWVAPAVSGTYEYKAEDVVFKEFKTASVVAGGTLETVMGTETLKPSTLTVPLSSEGAAMIYYACIDKVDGLTLTQKTPEEQYAAIISSKRRAAVKASTVEAYFTGLEPASEYYVYAVAVDAEGRYGKVTNKKFTLPKLEYNNISLSISEVEIKATTATLKVTSDGGDLSEYIYWFGPFKDPFWSNKCKLTKASASKYMALNAEDEDIQKAMRKYGALSSDGTITFTDLAIEGQYVFVILEKDEQGNFSMAEYMSITTLAADLGVIVREGSDRWNAAKATVKLDWIKHEFEQGAGLLPSRYAFDFSCTNTLTAFVLCGSDTYFSSDEYAKIEDVMIEIESYVSRSYDDGTTPVNAAGESAQEPDYYKDGEKKEGQLMNMFKFYVHGNPSLGCVTYFAPDTHGEGNCTSWEKGACSNYQQQLDDLAKYKTLEPYENRAAQFGLTGAEKDAWTQALYEAYMVYYKDATPILYVNNGDPICIKSAYATGLNEKKEVVDRVIVMFKDHDGNYFEPMYFEVPNYFE